MVNIFSNLFGIRSNISAVTESDVGVKPEEEIDIDEGFEEFNSVEIELAEDARDKFFNCVETQEELEALNSLSKSGSQDKKTISYALKPLLYTAKYGAKALSATTVVVSYTLNSTSYVIAGVSYVPHGASKLLEKCKGEDKNTARYKVATASQNLLDLTSGAMYAVLYVPYGAAVVLNGVSGVTGSVDSYLSKDKIDEICTQSDSFINNLSSKLKGGIKTENLSQALAIAS